MKVAIGRYTVDITHPDKVLLPPGITKGDLIHYYDSIADRMVPYLKDRPLMMHRFPEGLSGESFYQKDISSYFPSWIKTCKVPKKDGFNTFVLCQNRATLVYLANQACITPHLSLGRCDKLNYPDRMIFDLDPPRLTEETFKTIRFLALQLKELLASVGLRTFTMTTGSRGLHVIVPLNRTLLFPDVKACADLCAQIIIHEYPQKATQEIRKEKRHDKIFIDTLRNQYSAMAVAPYAVRAKEGAPVATPLHWHEIEAGPLSPTEYTISTIFERLKTQDDPWADLLTTRQSLTSPLKKLKKLITW